MSIEQTYKVDLLGFNQETGNIEIAIVDHLDWNTPDDHLQLLQDKVNAYLSFIESGEIYKTYPKARNRKFTIILYVDFEPSKVGENFIKKLGEVLSKAGYDFKLVILKRECD